MSDKHRGRPTTDNPKTMRVDVRLTEEELQMLDKYCQQSGVSCPQGLRDGIKVLTRSMLLSYVNYYNQEGYVKNKESRQEK